MEEDSFFDSIVYGFMCIKIEGKEKPKRERAKEVLGENFYEELFEIKEEIKLERPAFGCFLVNQLISKYGYFFKFFERRDKYRFLVIKKVDAKDKNKITRNLSSSVIEKFHGYQTVKHGLAHKEQIDLEALCIVYDTSYSEDENVPAPCFFSD